MSSGFPPLDRRRFLRWSLSGAGLALTGPWFLEGCRGTPPPAGARRVGGAPGAPPFSDLQRAVLAAAASRILPSNDGSGAAEAGCIDAIEGTLADPYFSYKAPRFRQGADVLESLARSQWKKPFVDLAPADQDRCLEHLQAGKSNTAVFNGSLFFDDLLIFTVEGFLGHPQYGGNRDKVGWTFIGYEPGGPGPGECHGK
ncbi:MAG: gluconate 2-dehydrogenase subunit 3 family protein [Planctomycetes bacterium]|nr:gluconate 2-dehydrogenase subunit 3 family protein [Planctomycetota bacterium]